MTTGKSTTQGGNGGGFLRAAWGRVSRFREGTLILVIIGICIVMSFLSPYFLQWDNLRTTILSFAINGIVVIGMTIVMVNGGIDLSVGSVMALIGAVAGRLYQSGVDIWIAAPIALILGALLGLFNGFFITRVGLSPFITTLAMLSIARGAAFVVTKGIPLSLYSMPNAFKSIGKGDVAGVPIVIIIFILFVIVADFMMRRSTILRRVVYTGSSEKAAVFSGINVRGVKLGVYVLSSALAGLGGILSIARFATATPYFASGLELQAISACVIGGASLAGGDGSIIGSVFGIALLAIITTSMILLNVSVYWQDLVSGIILLTAVSIDYFTHARSR
jgi:ribose transport system permease protein